MIAPWSMSIAQSTACSASSEQGAWRSLKGSRAIDGVSAGKSRTSVMLRGSHLVFGHGDFLRHWTAGLALLASLPRDLARAERADPLRQILLEERLASRAAVARARSARVARAARDLARLS